jgi:hypothetical protein
MSFPRDSQAEVFQPKPLEMSESIAFDRNRSSCQPFIARCALHHGQSKKASATSPAGHDYRQPKVEEGTDAFWQVRIRIEMSWSGLRCSAARRGCPLDLLVRP